MPDKPWCGGEIPKGRLDSRHVLHWSSPTDESRPAYACVPLSFHPHGATFDFAVGERVETVLPADVLAACVERGEVSFERPKVAKAAVA